ncbi:rubredoxin [Streptomyces sp. NPDC002870]|jgi:rubredoxin|uniref:rubredoxin n=1 Tax=Streptomyces sp. NPDC002870 TaxID=3364666 RepID=UPI0036AF25CF
MNDQSSGKRAWMCLLCGWVYYEELGLPEEGIEPGTRWEDIPDTWECPDCGAMKADFVMEEL